MQKGNSNFNGSLSSIGLEYLQRYLIYLDTLISKKDWKKSVYNLNSLINENPVLRLNWENGIAQCSNTLKNKTGKDVLDLVNEALHTPPSWEFSIMIGFPINAIFFELMQCQNGRNFFAHAAVNEKMKDILDDYHDMLESPISLKFMNQKSPNGWFSPEAQTQIDYSLYKCNPNLQHYGFKNWNEWFLREFKSGVRQIGFGTPSDIPEQNVIVNCCQATPIVLPIQPVRNVQLTDLFWLKDNRYSLVDMFGQYKFKKGYSSLFENGTVYQAYLSATTYHRWHAPVDATVVDVYSIPGTYYLDQSQFLGHYDHQGTESQAFLSAVATRMVMVMKADNAKIGYIAIVFIGMAEVSSCISKVNVNDKVKKGDLIGNFAFGGSSHLMVFQKDAKLKFNEGLYDQCNGTKSGLSQKLHSYLAHLDCQ